MLDGREAGEQQLILQVKARGYGVHLDGARVANAAAAGFDLEGIAGLGVDLFVLGGAKAGMPPTVRSEDGACS